MHIKKLIIEADNGQATITLNYNEIKCICSSLFRLSKIEKVRKESDFDEVMDGFISLFNILKHGMIPESELQTMCNLICEQVPEIEKGGAVIANLYAFPNTTNYIQEMDEKIKYIEENKDGNATIWDVNGCCHNLDHSYTEVKESLFTRIEGDENGN